MGLLDAFFWFCESLWELIEGVWKNPLEVGAYLFCFAAVVAWCAYFVAFLVK